MAQKPAGEILPGRSVVQVFRANDDCLSVVSVMVGTFRAIQSCHLKLSLYEIPEERADLVRMLSRSDDTSNSFKSRVMRRLVKAIDVFPAIERLILQRKRLIAEMLTCCDAINDNSSLDLFVKAPRLSRGNLYLLKISSPDGAPGGAATVWLNDEISRIPGHVWCSVGGKDTTQFGIMAQVGSANPAAVDPVPPALLISTVTQCNLNCIHCISRSTRGGVARLSSDIRAQIERWAHKGQLKTAATDYSGDILWADERFGGDLDFLIGLGVPFHLDTNGVCLYRETSKRLMNSRVASINVSLDAARDETFRRVRAGAPPLEMVLQNMRGLSEERKRCDRTDVRLSIGFTLMRSNIDELPEAIALARNLDFDVVITRHLEAYTADMAHESLWHDKERFNSVRATALVRADKAGVKLWIAAPLESGRTQQGHNVCLEPWRSAVVLGNGDVHVCCVPGPGTLMGNLHEQSMEEIWNGPRYRHFRTIVNSEEPPPACKACPIYRKDNNPDSYMPFVVTQPPELRAG